ncbi:homeodomain-interacting protein kinase 2-like isoform X1 [Lates japonicus]|uniref:Homeodomain-interacting protein kinase 2-like isoform X1 n=1 Tax=Lates japonicus TaxID=270547 RepID=A0AAD3MQ49_LATJO|nr:homeodomain-interacting protein kinase 2-like isoform X1 [Lates japonicus]
MLWLRLAAATQSQTYGLCPGVCVQITWYRAPEVMLHIPFNEAIISMRSLGLVAAELDTGCPLYPGQMDDDVLSITVKTQGQPADCVLDCGNRTDYYFHRQQSSQQRWRFKTPEEFAYKTGSVFMIGDTSDSVS